MNTFLCLRNRLQPSKIHAYQCLANAWKYKHHIVIEGGVVGMKQALITAWCNVYFNQHVHNFAFDPVCHKQPIHNDASALQYIFINKATGSPAKWHIRLRLQVVTAGLETTIGAPLHHVVQQQVDYIHYKLHEGTSFEAIEKFYMVSVD